jgi:hypothetical protein
MSVIAAALIIAVRTINDKPITVVHTTTAATITAVTAIQQHLSSAEAITATVRIAVMISGFF